MSLPGRRTPCIQQVLGGKKREERGSVCILITEVEDNTRPANTWSPSTHMYSATTRTDIFGIVFIAA